PATPYIYTLSLHDALPIFLISAPLFDILNHPCHHKGPWRCRWNSSFGYHVHALAERILAGPKPADEFPIDYDRDGAAQALSSRRSEEHTSELQSRSDLVCR